LGFLGLQSEVVDDRPCGLRSTAEVRVDFKIDGRLLGLIFKTELLESSQRTGVGNFVELTSRGVDDPTFLFSPADCQANEADGTTVAFNDSQDVCREAR
jgi:hypothetical protein